MEKNSLTGPFVPQYTVLFISCGKGKARRAVFLCAQRWKRAMKDSSGLEHIREKVLKQGEDPNP